MKLRTLFFALLAAAGPGQAIAKDYSDFVSVGLGDFDFDKHQDRRKSVDYRVEYEWGTSLLPDISRSFRTLDHFIQIHPTVGAEGNSKGAVYGNGGLDLDVPLGRHGIFTWGEALGAFSHGDDARSLGAILEFRSQLELGWRFDNNLRLTGFISHLSNGGLGHENPGAEIVGAYLRIPLSKVSRQ